MFIEEHSENRKNVNKNHNISPRENIVIIFVKFQIVFFCFVLFFMAPAQDSLFPYPFTPSSGEFPYTPPSPNMYNFSTVNILHHSGTFTIM